ncbi:MAG: poly-gamma-glutamate biosynthesis protein PgsC/CapC, partial [Planctomycetes bacterium]|nr:poly-gamma-glutamate biosynthesis protein PgsC/CapC [Planctomycetota bacterium]
MFPLRIFPENSLAQSVITTVWVGVFVVSYFNLRLGWPFSGLVVPGYLVPLMIAKPTAAAVVCIEGFLTYLIVRYACNHYMGSGLWSSFFGRDRFFALIVASIIVRLLLDGILLPLAGEFINRRLNIDFDYRNHLSSFGLIIVALIANQFWKTGFVRGLVPFWTTVGITYAIIRFVLIPYTNFNIGNLEYMYENISTSLVASPKAYI